MTSTLIDQLRERANNPSLSSDRAASFPRTPGDCLDESDILCVERQLGFSIPSLLRDTYLRVGNGGWGPGCGLLPLIGKTESSDCESASGLYEIFTSPNPTGPAWIWPRYLLPFCDWGCAIRSCVACDLPLNPVVTFDPGALEVGDRLDTAVAPVGLTLQDWFEAWLSGVDLWSQMYEPDPGRATVIINPFTKEELAMPRLGGLLARANAPIQSEFGVVTQHVSLDASVGEANRRMPRS